jgi:hypothetical protein
LPFCNLSSVSFFDSAQISICLTLYYSIFLLFFLPFFSLLSSFTFLFTPLSLLFYTNKTINNLLYQFYTLPPSYLFLCNPQWLRYTFTHIRPILPHSPYTLYLYFPSTHSLYSLFYCHHFNYLSISMQTIIISPIPTVYTLYYQGFIYYINIWFGTESVNLLLLKYRSVNRNITTK